MPRLGDFLDATNDGPITPAARLRRVRLEREALAEATEKAWQPHDGPQTVAFYSLADELYYGGEAGGGKTDLLLGLAGKAHYKSLILRREFPRMRDMIERSREIYNVPNGYNESLHVWRLPSGRMVEFGSVAREEFKENYRGRAHDLKGWDEIPEFSEGQFRFINTWNRTARPGQRSRIVACGNPPATKSGLWVIAYWAPWLDRHHKNPAIPGEIRWFARLDDRDEEVADGTPFAYGKEIITPRSRTFIRARLSDNPILEQTGYRSILQNLPEPLRSQLLYGDFLAAAPDDPWQVIPTEWVRLAQARWTEKRPDGVMLSQVGNDPSRGGGDETTFAKRYDHWIAPLIVYPGSAVPDGPAVVAYLHTAIKEDLDEARRRNIKPFEPPICVDVIGIGASVYDHAKVDYNAVALNGAEKSFARDRSGKLHFANRRSEFWWNLRELLDPAYGENVALPPDPRILSDLTAAKWSLTVRGIQVEEKKHIKERIGRSPDRGEAIVYAFARPALVSWSLL